MAVFANNLYKLIDVQYVEDVKRKYSDLINEDKDGFYYKLGEIGIYKSKEWSFQKECRYRLILLPKDESMKLPTTKAEEIAYIINNVREIKIRLDADKPLNTDYIDLSLDEDKLKHIEVTMGPMTSEGDRFIVESLLKDYPDAVIKDSYFKSKIRK